MWSEGPVLSPRLEDILTECMDPSDEEDSDGGDVLSLHESDFSAPEDPDSDWYPKCLYNKGNVIGRGHIKHWIDIEFKAY